MIVKRVVFFIFVFSLIVANTTYSQEVTNIEGASDTTEIDTENPLESDEMSATNNEEYSKDTTSDTATNSEEDSEDWYYNKPIRSISFKGLSNVKSSDVEAITASFIGKNFTDDNFNELVDRIYSLDVFEDMSPEAVPGDSKKRTVSIVFTVKERPIISRILIVGNRQIRNAEIKDAISIKEKDVFVQSKIFLDERAVRDLYLGKGFTNVKVSSSTKENDRGIVLTFNVQEGNSTVIAQIAFRGNNLVSSKTLKSQLTLKEIGMFSKGAFQEATLEQDKQKIVAYYNDRGYMDATILDVLRDINSNEAKHRDELTITFVVQEGFQYTFAGATFTGNTIFSTEYLSSLVRLKEGAVFNQTKFQESARLIADLYYENGYTSNNFIPEMQKDTDRRTITYNITIVENPRSHVEHIIIKGTKKTKDEVILREIPLEAGDIFSKAKVENGMRNLYNLQYFSAIVPNIVPGSEENLVDLVLSVEEQSTTSVEFGLTFSGVDDPDELPFALFLKWQDSNVMGTGKTISASTTIATNQQSIGMGFGENWFLKKPISFGINADLTHSNITTLRNYVNNTGYVDTDDYYMEYEQWRISFGTSLGRRWTPNFAILSWACGVNSVIKTNLYDEKLWIPLDTNVRDYANLWGIQNAIWTSFSIDGRDINYDPSRGWFTSQRLTWYGLLPIESEYFLRTDTKIEKYFTFINWKVTENWAFRLTLAGYSGLSMLFPVDWTTLGDNSKLYIDGMFNARGWTDIYNTVRGRAMWSNIVEIRFPVVPRILALDFFYDAATIKEDPWNLFNKLKAEDFFYSYGPSIRFCLPQFPLRLIFARRFTIQHGHVKYEDDGNFKFVLSFNLINK